MADTPKKVAVIGLDCALAHLIEKHISEGHLPTFKKLIDQGVIADNCLAPFPTITPPNWATIATGATTGTHGVSDFHVQDVGGPLDETNVKQAFNSERVKAEFIWDALDKAGKKCIVVNYPGGWPSHMENGIMIGGGGLSIGEIRDGRIRMNTHMSFCHDQLITTGIYPAAIRGEFEAADDWDNCPDMGEDPMEMEATLRFPGTDLKPAPTTWNVLIRQTGGDGYDKATLSPTTDFNDAFCTLGVGEWSPKIFTKIKLEDGGEREVFFRCKLVALSDDAEDFRLFITGLADLSVLSAPPDAYKLIDSEEGTLAPSGAIPGYALGWYDLDTWVEINEQYTKFMADTAVSLMSKTDWDLFYMHAHSPDWMYHAIITDMDPALTKDEAKVKAAWDAHLKIYQFQDEMLARIIETAGEDALIMTVSDHGAVPDGTPFNPYNALVPAGLSVFEEKEISATAGQAVRMTGMYDHFATARVADPKKSKAIPMRSCYVYVNLKGRDPDGIVDPDDLQSVQQGIIDALYTYVDPETGKRPVALALTKEDARIIGLGGDSVGDVIYALYPEFGGQHGYILPTAKWGPGSLRVLFQMYGPGVKKGYRLERTCSLTDLVPTICYMASWPLPAQAEGSVVYQAFEDPNFKMKEVTELREQLAQMETQLSKGNE